jgi:hypothetical protein
VERAEWIDWTWRGEFPEPGRGTARIYLGSESCEKLMPDAAALRLAAGRLRDGGIYFSLVLPFAAQEGLSRAETLLDALCDVYPGSEAVCNDWGLLRSASRRDALEPVAGRLLARQRTDPRLAALFDRPYQVAAEREVLHADGFAARLTYRPPAPGTLASLSGVSLDDPEFADFLAGYRVRRMELDKPAQGLSLSPGAGLAVTLHVPDVFLAATRDCSRFPERAEGGCPNPGALGRGAAECAIPSERSYQGYPVPLYRLGNALYSLGSEDEAAAPSARIDRIVRRRAFDRICASRGFQAGG